MPDFVYLNNKFIDKKNAKISIEDRGFLFGDGVFETCKIVNRKIVNFNSHLKRLEEGLKKLKINFAVNNLADISHQLIKKNKAENSLLKIVISRGEGSFGYLPKENIKPTILIQNLALRETPKKINLSVSSNFLYSKNNAKTLNSLAYVLTKIEAKEKGFFDLVLLNSNNYICETSSANIFWIKDNQIFTPDEKLPMIKGVVRDFLLKNKQLKIKKVKAKISDLAGADEIFLTNSSFFILPINSFNNKKLSTKISKKLQKLDEKYYS
jgi:aminodeoxychorismate lyase